MSGRNIILLQPTDRQQIIRSPVLNKQFVLNVLKTCKQRHPKWNSGPEAKGTTEGHVVDVFF